MVKLLAMLLRELVSESSREQALELLWYIQLTIMLLPSVLVAGAVIADKTEISALWLVMREL